MRDIPPARKVRSGQGSSPHMTTTCSSGSECPLSCSLRWAVHSVTELITLGKHLPAEADEALLWLAEGIPPEEVREAVAAPARAKVDPADLAAALEHPEHESPVRHHSHRRRAGSDAGGTPG